MAMVLDAFVSFFVERLAALAEREISMLRGVPNDLHALRSTLLRLERLLADAESRRTSIAVADWLARIRDVMYDADDLLDDCRAAAAEAATLPRRRRHRLLRWIPPIRKRHEVGVRVRAINERLRGLEAETGPLGFVASQPERNPRVWNSVDSSPVIVDEDIVGIDGQVRDLVGRLTSSSPRKWTTYAITGMPGIGKTTLAQKVYNDPVVKNHFKPVFWICVSKEYNYVNLLKKIARKIRKDDEKQDKDELDRELTQGELDEFVSSHVNGKRFLLVLDDVWNADVWEKLRIPLRNGANESRVLITTRNEMVANAIGVAHILPASLLSDKKCWTMLCKVVFGDIINNNETEDLMKRLERTGMKIAEKCKGLPLSVKAIGGVLKMKEKDEAAWNQVRLNPTWQLKNLHGDINPGILLSFEDLPSYLKQCLIYCSLFPEDFRFHRHFLVQMWIAEGFVEGDEELEELGEQYYKELVMRNLLQAMPEYYDGKGCTMHDLVRALARHSSQNEFQLGDPHQPQSTSTELRHLPLIGEGSSKISNIIQHECLRTLLLSRNPMLKEIPSHVFEKLKRLRVLVLTYTGIENLPDSLGNLMHLRLLDVSFTKLKVLPETIRNLKNLQTLKANGLKYLVKLPTGIMQLLNMRHLTVGSTYTQLKEMPAGLRSLEKLRTLDGFVANSRRNMSNIEDLEFLSYLTYLSMYKLERIAGRAEAMGAVLDNKSKLNFLRLSCTQKPNTQQFKEEAITRIEGVFEGLRPPTCTDGIVMEYFFGRQLPAWIMKCYLTKLTWLRLNDCRFVTQLPPLGQLPNLRVVHIWNLPMVSEIGPDFFNGTSGFPKLLELSMLEMTSLEKISGLENGVLPFLKKLHISRCPKLDSLPEGLQFVPNLSKMVIEGGESIKSIKDLSKIEELKLMGNSRLKSISDLPSLNRLDINVCLLEEISGVDRLSHIILSDSKMRVLPSWLGCLTSLQRLDIRGTPALLSRCLIDKEDWPKIKHVCRIEARSLDGLSYISYTRDPQNFQSNMTVDAIDDQPLCSLSVPENTEEGYSSRTFTSFDAEQCVSFYP